MVLCELEHDGHLHWMVWLRKELSEVDPRWNQSLQLLQRTDLPEVHEEVLHIVQVMH